MAFLSNLLKNKNIGDKLAKISVLGPTKAGKTTFIRYLETGEEQTEEPMTTLGIEYRQEPVKFGNWEFYLIDVGGQQVYQELFWHISISQANGIVYMVDASITPDQDKTLFEEHVEQFKYVLDSINEDALLLIILNKQDLENAFDVPDFKKLYPVNEIGPRTVAMYPASAKYGTGLDDVLKWFTEVLPRNIG